ncbi:MAG: Asp-tRNA(Asn)/Glu-tRNA(Gln) amidotransferase subunit GatA [Acidobacteria bacterium]|nr:MAG: Asp-tRNA(Asn)/Glu-tRNA(Gln) amidotransferase subunit GatA [Acidobacteriota bacterium]
MKEAELKQLTLSNAASLLRSKEISPVELVQATLERIEGLNERVRAFITITAAQALERAKVAEREIVGGHIPPLQGIPLSVKDLFDTNGIKTTAGSKVFANRVPHEDAVVVRKLYEAGAVIVGKTNMHEFAFGTTTVNPHYGTALNPWKPEHISGGSSGGSASSLAMSMGLGSIGSDTGGSIRIPASMCGIVGLKPTYGRVSLQGTIPLSWTFDHAGPMARTVEDVAMLLKAVSDYDCLKDLTGEIKDISVGVPLTYFYERFDPEVEKALRTSLKALEKLGAQLIEVDLPSAPEQRRIFDHIVGPEAYVYHEPFLKERGDLYGVDVKNRIEPGATMHSTDYVRALRSQLVMKQECDEIFETAVVVVTPTLPIPAPRIDALHKPWGADSETAIASLTRFTRPFNIVGLPTISIPCGFTADGLPIGMQITGRAFDEATVLRVAHAYEQDAKWFQYSIKF